MGGGGGGHALNTPVLFLVNAHQELGFARLLFRSSSSFMFINYVWTFTS